MTVVPGCAVSQSCQRHRAKGTRVSVAPRAAWGPVIARPWSWLHNPTVAASLWGGGAAAERKSFADAELELEDERTSCACLSYSKRFDW